MKFIKVKIEHIKLAIKDFKEKGFPEGFKASAYFDIEIDGIHELTSLNIPLYIQVQDQKGRFVYGLKGGVYGRRMIKNSFEATEITSSLSELKSSEVSVIDQPNISNKWTADVLGGVVLAPRSRAV